MSKVIIADPSCLIALDNIGLLTILKDLYHEIFITAAVREEFGEELPIWIKVQQVNNTVTQSDLENLLDKGEASSIALALEYDSAILIIDELKGRRIAKSKNIEIIGTIGVLLLAEKRGFVINVIDVILKLVNKGFRLSDALLETLLNRYK